MEHYKKTEVTDSNRNDYFRAVYKVQTLRKDELINLHQYSTFPIVIVDSCGWYYKEHFPNANIVKFEGIQTCKMYNLSPNHFDKLFNDNTEIPKIPNLDFKNSTLIIDHSPVLLKYRTVAQAKEILEQCCYAVSAETARIRMSLVTFGDERFCDRAASLLTMVPDNYIITSVHYTTEMFDVEFRRKAHYDLCVD